MPYDKRYSERSPGNPEDKERDPSDYDRGYGRDPEDRDPGAHVDFYSGGDRGQQRIGPEGGCEMPEDYRRTDLHAEQGRSPTPVVDSAAEDETDRQS